MSFDDNDNLFEKYLAMPDIKIRDSYKRKLDIMVYSRIEKLKNQKTFSERFYIFIGRYGFKASVALAVFVFMFVSIQPSGVNDWAGFGALPAASSTLAPAGPALPEDQIVWQIENDFFSPSALKVYKIDNTGRHAIKVNNKLVKQKIKNGRIRIEKFKNNGLSFNLNQPNNRYQFSFSLAQPEINSEAVLSEMIYDFWRANQFIVDDFSQPQIRRLPVPSEKPELIKHEMIEFPWQVGNMPVFTNLGRQQSLLTLEVKNNQVVQGDSILNTNYLQSVYPIVSLAQARQRLAKSRLSDNCFQGLASYDQLKIELARARLAYLEKQAEQQVYLLPVYIFEAKVYQNQKLANQCRCWVDAVSEEYLVE